MAIRKSIKSARPGMLCRWCVCPCTLGMQYVCSIVAVHVRGSGRYTALLQQNTPITFLLPTLLRSPYDLPPCCGAPSPPTLLRSGLLHNILGARCTALVFRAFANNTLSQNGIRKCFPTDLSLPRSYWFGPLLRFMSHSSFPYCTVT